jgi:PAS domain S-box-containing protein
MRRRVLLPYAVALVAVALAVAVRYALDPLWGPRLPFITLIGAVIAAGWYGGLRPGLFATALGVVCADLLWVGPRGAFGAPGLIDLTGILAFAVIGVFISIVSEAPRRAMARLDALLDASPFALGFHTRDLRYIRVNHHLAQINRRPADEHPGRTVREVLGAAAADVVEPVLRRVVETGESVHVPSVHVALEHQPARWYSVTYAPVRSLTGRVTGASVGVVDVTERQETQTALAHERELLQTIIDTIPVMITLYEPGTRLLRLNREFERVLGWTAAEAATRDLMEACYPDPGYRAMVREYMDSVQPGWRDIEMTTRRGDVVSTSWSTVRLSDDSRVGIGLDVTDRKRYESDLERARVAAESDSRLKDEFIAMLGHELRNPLSAISAAISVLQRVGAEDAGAAAARSVIQRQTGHLARLMDDLLDVGRVMTGKIALARQPLRLREITERAVATLRATGGAAHHTLSVDGDDPWVYADATRIEQIVTNLLSNALKYTPAGGAITITVDTDGADAALRMRDTGRGIAAELLPRVFDLFVQGEQSTERAAGGLGIGLTLVRRLAELHGGRVDVASRGPGQGATFTVRLPRVAAPAATPAPTPSRRAPRLTIVVVEDNDDARDMLRAMLELQGHAVSTAGDGPSGMEAIRAVKPDVALVDIGLPGMDGYEMARQLRAGAGCGSTLIALTGYGQAEDARRAREAGFDLHVVKPVEPATLSALLGSLARPE